MAEKQSTEQKKMGRKPKYDYTSQEFLDQIASYAKQGFTDKEIALSIGLSPQKFYEKKGEISELSDTLAHARASLNAAETSSCRYSPTADWQVGVSSILHLFAILSVFLQVCGEVISNAYKSPSEANYGTKTG